MIEISLSSARRRELEYIANEYFNEACKLKEKDLEKARENFAISWGINRYLERVEFMVLCERSLAATGLREGEIRNYQNYGYEVASKSIRIVDTALKFLRAGRKNEKIHFLYESK